MARQWTPRLSHELADLHKQESFDEHPQDESVDKEETHHKEGLHICLEPARLPRARRLATRTAKGDYRPRHPKSNRHKRRP